MLLLPSFVHVHMPKGLFARVQAVMRVDNMRFHLHHLLIRGSCFVDSPAGTLLTPMASGRTAPFFLFCFAAPRLRTDICTRFAMPWWRRRAGSTDEDSHSTASSKCCVSGPFSELLFKRSWCSSRGPFDGFGLERPSVSAPPSLTPV